MTRLPAQIHVAIAPALDPIASVGPLTGRQVASQAPPERRQRTDLGTGTHEAAMCRRDVTARRHYPLTLQVAEHRRSAAAMQRRARGKPPPYRPIRHARGPRRKTHVLRPQPARRAQAGEAPDDLVARLTGGRWLGHHAADYTACALVEQRHETAVSTSHDRHATRRPQRP